MIVLGDLVLLGILEFVGIVIVVFYPMEFLLLFYVRFSFLWYLDTR
jgi:hypothetical protein